MKEFLLTALIGVVIGMIDILPMIKMKHDKYSIGSAFVFYFMLPFVICNIDLYGLVWWIKGGLVGLCMALPIIILVAKDDKSAVPPMLIMSVVLATIISAIHHFLM